jgi:hypothetical protein
MFNNQIVIAAIRVAELGGVAQAIGAVREVEVADVVVVLTDIESVLVEARELDAVDRFVPSSLSTEQALVQLLDSDDGWIDEAEDPWVLLFDRDFDRARAAEVSALVAAGKPGQLTRLRSLA